jgi:DNA repair exonuclease SbcCD nuclease subunit
MVMAGNHDQADRLGCNTVLPAITIPEDILVETSATYQNLGFVAHQWEIGDFHRKVKALGKVDFLFIHQDIEGALWRPDFASDTGVPGKDWPYQHVFAGHYHHPHDVSGHLTVVGSPCYLDWSDQLIQTPLGGGFEVRGILLWDEEKGMWRVENPHTPIRHTLEVDKSGEVVRFLHMLKAKQRKRLLLRVRCSRAKIAENVERKVGELKTPPARLQVQVRGEKQWRSTELKIDVRPDNPEQALREFVTHEKPDLDADRLVKVGLEALKGVK